jgi:hypothetical protein
MKAVGYLESVEVHLIFTHKKESLEMKSHISS